jgi:SAM-dependent methyltransferase
MPRRQANAKPPPYNHVSIVSVRQYATSGHDGLVKREHFPGRPIIIQIMKTDVDFSKQARAYARHRPHYSPRLFEYLASLTAEHELAWDCGTGSGQAAVGLAGHFRRVVGTDVSPKQLAQASRQGNILYWAASAERSGLRAGLADLVTVAQALHWFDFDRFYPEVKRILKPGGMFAAWTYHLPEISPPVDRLVDGFYRQRLDGYWATELHYIDELYRTIPLPFEEIESPAFGMTTDWELENLLGFMQSWSASQRFLEMNGYSPIDDIRPALTDAWSAPSRRRVHWTMFLRVGRFHP